MGVCEILTIIFIVLKVLGVIQWNWFLVLLPEIIACVIYLIFIIQACRLNSQIRKELKEFWEDE